MNTEQIRDLFDVDKKLIHGVMKADLLLNNDNNPKVVTDLLNAHKNSTNSSGENSQMNSTASTTVQKDKAKRAFSEVSSESSSDSERSSIALPESKVRKIDTSVQSTIRYCQPNSSSKADIYSSSESSIESSYDEPSSIELPASKVKKVDTSLQSTSRSSQPSSAIKIDKNSIITEPNIYSSSDSSSYEPSSIQNGRYVRNIDKSKSSSDESLLIELPASKVRKVDTSLQPTTRSSQPSSATKIKMQPITDSSSEASSSDDDSTTVYKMQIVDASAGNTESTSSTSYKDFVIPENLEDLRKLMDDSKYLERFGYETDLWGKKFPLFDDIYCDDGEIDYAAFHSAKMIEMICGSKDCKLFFYFSQELLQQFNTFSEVQFVDVKHILMVFVSGHELVSPFGFFLLPDQDDSLRNVPKVISGWLNRKQSPTDVTKCIAPYNPILQRSIAEIWPKAKIIGCSAEYHKDIKDFAKQNKGLGAEHKTKLTRLACSLCYLEEKYFVAGIKVIEKYSESDYGVNLIQHLRTKWLAILKSIDGEQIMHRSLMICQQFSKQMERDYFLQYSMYTDNRGQRAQEKHKHIWEFIDFLKTLTFIVKSEMHENQAGAMTSKNFGCNTDLQKEKENRYQSAATKLNKNLKVKSELEAVELFMLQVSLNV